MTSNRFVKSVSEQLYPRVVLRCSIRRATRVLARVSGRDGRVIELDDERLPRRCANSEHLATPCQSWIRRSGRLTMQTISTD